MNRYELECVLTARIATSMGEKMKNILDLDISPEEMGKMIDRLRDEYEAYLNFVSFIIQMDEKLDKILGKLED